jgi:DNA-binding IscR family transcriptional regulator
MLSTRTLHGLKLVAYIASAPCLQIIQLTQLSRLLGFSISYTESLMKDLKNSGFLLEHVHPSEGYTLNTSVHQVSTLDLSKCFDYQEALTQSERLSPKTSCSSTLRSELDEIEELFLQNYVLTEITKKIEKNLSSPKAGLLIKQFRHRQMDFRSKASNSSLAPSNFIHRMQPKKRPYDNDKYAL